MEINNKQKEKVELKIQWKHKINDFFINYFNWLVLVLTIIILIVGYFLLIQSKFSQTASKTEYDINDLEVEYLNKQNYLNKIKQLKIIYENIKKDDKIKVGGIIPASAEIEKVITEVESIVIKNGLILASLSVEPEKESQSVSRTISDSDRTISDRENRENEQKNLPVEVAKVKILINLVGVDYGALKSIIKMIENNLRLMDIIKIDYNPNEGKVAMEVSAYYMP